MVLFLRIFTDIVHTNYPLQASDSYSHTTKAAQLIATAGSLYNMGPSLGPPLGQGFTVIKGIPILLRCYTHTAVP